jgi:hypothetical protein
MLIPTSAMRRLLKGVSAMGRKEGRATVIARKSEARMG